MTIKKIKCLFGFHKWKTKTPPIRWVHIVDGKKTTYYSYIKCADCNHEREVKTYGENPKDNTAYQYGFSTCHHALMPIVSSLADALRMYKGKSVWIEGAGDIFVADLALEKIEKDLRQSSDHR